MKLELTPSIALHGGNVSADNLPPKSYLDFSFTFLLAAEGIASRSQHAAVAAALVEAFPHLKVAEQYGDGFTTVWGTFNDKDWPGITKHMVELYESVDYPMTVVGGSHFTEPPLMRATSPTPVDLPDVLKSFESFTASLAANIDRALAAA
jgi:hypothetical protein